jgi:flagellar biosynthesis chaperone FliJ
MKLGKGNNEYHLNAATMVAILNEHLKYNTDQVVTGVSCHNNSGLQTFIVQLEDKRPQEVEK